MKVPRHVALIPDGNRRWAKEQGLKSFDGHAKGVAVFKSIAEHAFEKGVQYVSLWGMSIDNFTKRSELEVAGLLSIFEKEFVALTESDQVHERRTRIRVLGRWDELFPKKTKQVIHRALEATKGYDMHHLTLLLGYNGTDDMRQAIEKMARRGEHEVTDEVIKSHLMTADLPAVDLLCRTGGEPHLSAGFMMWDIADAELFFTEVYWPDFTPDIFDQALEYYAGRQRRRGR